MSSLYVDHVTKVEKIDLSDKAVEHEQQQQDRVVQSWSVVLHAPENLLATQGVWSPVSC